MPDSLPIGLLYGVTGTVTGPVQVVQGQICQYAGATGAPVYNLPIHVTAHLGGASPTSCTIIIEASDALAGSYTTWATLALTAARPNADFTGMINVAFIRARVSASSGTNAINAYLFRHG